MNELEGLLTIVERQIPRNLTELYLVEVLSMITCACVAAAMGFVHRGRFDLYRVLRNGLGGGAALPPSLLLVLYPVSQPARDLFGTEALKGYLMMAGASGAVLSVYGLFKP